jgi:hypothetical protein
MCYAAGEPGRGVTQTMPLGGRKLKEMRPLQSIVDPFVKMVGGEVISELIGNKNLPANADYLFRNHNVIAELKSLQVGGFAESFYRKFAELLGKWDRQGRLRVYGRVQLQSSSLPDACRQEMFAVMGESIQKHVIAAANKQIKSTKSLLNLPLRFGPILGAGGMPP